MNRVLTICELSRRDLECCWHKINDASGCSGYRDNSDGSLNVNKTSGNGGDNDNDGSSVSVISRESTHVEAVVMTTTMAAAALL